MKETNKWSVRDVITTVLLSAVLIVIQLVVNMVCMANDFVSMVLSVGDHHVPLRAGLYAHGQPDRQAFCDADLYDDPRRDFPADGQLVFAPPTLSLRVSSARQFCGSAAPAAIPSA